jgi:hypothetical protein
MPAYSKRFTALGTISFEQSWTFERFRKEKDSQPEAYARLAGWSFPAQKPAAMRLL